MMDRVRVNNLCLFGRHGVSDAEQALGQRLYLDIECEVRRSNPPLDRLDDTVCYAELCDLAREETASHRFRLIETLGHHIARLILDRFERVEVVRITVRKPFAPIPQAFDHVGVEIEHRRNA